MSVIACLAGGDLSARPRTFVAGQGVRLKTEVPAGYSFATQTNQHGMTLVKLENPVWNISVAVIISPEYSAEAEGEEWQKNIVVTQSADFLAQSKEQDYKFFPLKPVNGSGVYCVFTDPEAKRPEDLKPGEYLHVVVGAKVIRGAVMYFQIYNNDVKSAEYREVFDLFINGFDEA
ncbi:MAG: hypothetical protein IAE82_10705 [Opitutaceae bacterium]|nr:hypothetical protein [Opitutaceae bacterium]